ncbi:DUF21 domain-containing protein [Candidatus Peregrinibacteria bacterium]|jgi:putative hemolysin|nr:DUF21 domain-containing protein [Candidatus Peregrinibacteria bacterium]MBT6730479.1 DUF21 domain-containing protein [Candidatus Peregrinibacteria bacterium]MBT7009383.1 DUF21 domain-containing protein [Candidatus Peregrinibacteria bacterium]MBT7345310.1 DUF21 domain-containing protein [Candidatus Peregrinibacteria bacterium]
MITLILLTILFITISGILAMVDAAMLSVSHIEIEEMIMHKKKGSAALKALHKDITRAVVVIVIMTNTVNVLGPILVGQKAIQLYGSAVIGIITAVLAFGTIIFSEVIPKSLGAHYAPLISRVAAPLILFIARALCPIVFVLEKIANFFQSGKRVIGTEDQIRSLVTIGRRAGHIESDEGQLIHRAFILNDKTAADIMTPLKDIIGVKSEDTIKQAAKKVFNNTCSRYPVFGKSIHDVKGMVMSHDILEAITEGRDDESILSITRSSLVVSARRRCDQLITLFRDQHIHMAIVQKNAHTIGLVTLEDVLEELVGEIEDEMDVEK